ncbi:MAG: hypothetical protein IAG10_29255 [Planctomycetaceae bacterium]|nr:hypothetical protein [Planctomycetaceae bacterium]
MTSVLVLMLSVALCSEAIAGPRVDIVIGEKAPALERLAADELASQLKRVYEADVKIGSTAPADSPHIIFVGCPDTNPSMKPFADSWPSGDKKLTDQGHLIRSVTHSNKPALLIGGGSPVATYWAVAEFGHRLGIRSMLFGDLDPVAPPPLLLQAIDIVIEPFPKRRDWHFECWYYFDSDSWSTGEFRSVFRQLAKLRFNHVTIAIKPWQPYAHFEYSGIQRSTSQLLGKSPIVVSGDTLGRKAFAGAKVFEHPSVGGLRSYADRRAGAEKHLNGVIAAAHEFGLSLALQTPVNEYPTEFAVFWPERAAKLSSDDSRFRFKLSDLPRDPKLEGLLKAHLRALVETYPTIDDLEILITVRDEADARHEANAVLEVLAQPELLKRVDGRVLPASTLAFVPFAITRSVNLPNKSKPSASFMMDSTPMNTLPYFIPRTWQTTWDLMAKNDVGGFQVLHSSIGENDLPAYWLSRMCCGQQLSPEQACRALLIPVCGEEADHRVWKAVEYIQMANRTLSREDSWIGVPLVDAILEDPDSLPPAWGEARDGFLNAMNEMYRANTRARDGGREYTLYLARRFEYAFEYMNYAEATRKAAIAERKKDSATQIAELEKAIESLNNALNAIAAVVRSNSDRGLIAVLNEQGYRRLKKKLAEAEAAAK